MNDHLRYLGIPWLEGGRDFSGVDCFGIFVLIFKTELEIDVPDYTLDSAHFKEWSRRKDRKEFHVYPLYKMLDILYKPDSGMEFPKLKKYDIIWMKAPWDKVICNHVGIYWKDGMFLEARESSGSVLSKLSNRMHQINGIYRYKGLENG